VRLAASRDESALGSGGLSPRLRADQDYHDKEREHWIAWDGFAENRRKNEYKNPVA
jgi:hypothetical protein